MKSDEELVKAFRDATENLPNKFKRKEIERAYYKLNDGRFLVLEDHDIGKVIKFLRVKDLVEYFYNKGLKISASAIYKTLEGKRGNPYGYKIYYEEIN